MKLHKVSIKGLNNKINCNFSFNDDINIVTGINGSGKTALLKIIWYTISGNVDRIIPEINFDSFYLETNLYSIFLSFNKKEDVIEWEYHDKLSEESSLGSARTNYYKNNESEKLTRLIIAHPTSSLFFPTFRIIEGGYSMTATDRKIRTQTVDGKTITYISEPSTEIDQEFNKLSHKLSVLDHKFICSISTHNIVSLLTSRYAHISEQLNNYYLELSTSIIGQIEGVKSDIRDNKEEAFTILSELQKEAKDIKRKNKELLMPFTVLSELTETIFQHRGIRARSVTLGESINAIDSSVLSAGEKQMLSFLCYNAFYENSVIFIDEPELSLHPDWQRRLFPILLKQQASNQFVVATHSPFIYSKYEDKELVMSKEKGA
jgi:predicted ATP-dependent endonuclease of OLD family